MKNEDKTKLYGLTCFLFQFILLIIYLSKPDTEAFLWFAGFLYLPFFVIPLIVKLFFVPYINKDHNENFYRYGVLSSLILQTLWFLFSLVCVCLSSFHVNVNNYYTLSCNLLIMILIYTASFISSIGTYIIAGYCPPVEKDPINIYNFKRFVTGLFYGFIPIYIFTIAVILVPTFGAIINLILSVAK